MKKALVLIVLVLGACLSGQAQDYKPFQLYLGLGYAVPSGGGGGVLIDLEPSYRINDQIAVGIRFESAAMASDLGSIDPNSSVDVSAVGSYTVNGRYYFGDSNFRPYAGAGFGIYQFGSVSYDITGGATGSIDIGSKFGFYPRLGFDVGHFNMNFDYNIIGESNGVKNSYMGLRLGFFLFGGKK